MSRRRGKSTGRTPRVHDCGQHGMLTAAGIAAKSGASVKRIYAELLDGKSPEDLCEPFVVKPARDYAPSYRTEMVHTTGTMTIAMAMQVIRRFPTRPPSVEALVDAFGMHRSTAYRWRCAWLDSMGVVE